MPAKSNIRSLATTHRKNKNMSKKKSNAIKVATDGACESNPDGPGGWAFIATVPGLSEPIKISGGEESTTSNRMELTAILKCLEHFKEPKEFVIFSDSQYAINCITEWMYKWKKNNWKKGDGEDVKNVDLLEQIDTLISFHNVEMVWVRGHSGHKYNEIANEMAENEVQYFRPSFKL